MGRKRKEEPMARVTAVIPEQLKKQLQAAGVNLSQLFLIAAKAELEKLQKEQNK